MHNDGYCEQVFHVDNDCSEKPKAEEWTTIGHCFGPTANGHHYWCPDEATLYYSIEFYAADGENIDSIEQGRLCTQCAIELNEKFNRQWSGPDEDGCYYKFLLYPLQESFVTKKLQ